MNKHLGQIDPLTESVAMALTLMSEVLANPKDVTPALVRAWVLVLSTARVPVADISPVTAKLLTDCKFFPTPADFLAAWKPADDEEAAEELAWQKLLGLIDRYGQNASLSAEDFGGDGAALWALDRMGWQRVCDEMTTDKRAIWRAEFVRIYRAARKTGASCGYICGRHERENALRGKALQSGLVGVMVGRPEWKTLPTGHRAPALPAGEEQWEQIGEGTLHEFKQRLLPVETETSDEAEGARA